MSTFNDIFGNYPPAISGGGGEVQVVGGSFAMARQLVAVSAGTLSIDYTLGQQVQVLLDQNVTTISLIDFPENGGIIELVLVQDGTGGRTVAWPEAWKSAGGFKPFLSTAAGAIDRVMIAGAASSIMIDFCGMDYK